MKEFHETQKKAKDGKLIDYMVKLITLTDEGNFEITSLSSKTTNFIKNMLDFYKRDLAVDGGKEPEFEVAIIDGNIVIKENLEDALTALRHLDFISEKTEEAIRSSQEYSILKRAYALCKDIAQFKADLPSNLPISQPILQKIKLVAEIPAPSEKSNQNSSSPSQLKVF